MKVFINDTLPPENVAMLQALYSRSAESVQVHTEKLSKTGATKFMEKYYVGYGHDSIGDCGTTTIFIEDISILADKAIQDNPLYSGQETSTRYINFEQREIIDPVGSTLSEQILRGWMAIYSSLKPQLIEHLKAQYPLEEGQNESTWEKAINARSFDILRGFLPAGVTTQLSWSTNLRQARDNLLRLDVHPLREVRAIADEIRRQLRTIYPSSFGYSIKPEVADYMSKFGAQINYAPFTQMTDEMQWGPKLLTEPSIIDMLEDAVLFERPKGALLPRYLEQYGVVHCNFSLDYGSFRDLQRHRNGLCRVPVLTSRLGFEPWYVEQLPPNIHNFVWKSIDSMLNMIASMREQFQTTEIEEQYYLPLGMRVPVKLVYSLPQLVYVCELRSSPMVHPTLRRRAIEMARHLEATIPNIVLHCDKSPSPWDIRRGEQDIVEK